MELNDFMISILRFTDTLRNLNPPIENQPNGGRVINALVSRLLRMGGGCSNPDLDTDVRNAHKVVGPGLFGPMRPNRP